MEFFDYSILEIGQLNITVFSLVSVLFILIFARLSVWFLKKLIERRISVKSPYREGKRYAVFQIGKYIIYVIALIFIFQTIGLNISFLVTGSAALLVGIGFGLQNTFNDFISGIILLFDGTIEVGDVVEVGGLVGQIKRIGLRTTTITTRESWGVILPNSKFTTEQVVNWSHTSTPTRFSIDIGVAYGSDIPLVKQALESCVADHKHILTSPAPVVRFVDFGDSALLFEVLFWTHESFLVEFTKSDIRYQIDQEFRKHEIKIPFPQRDLHFIS